MISSFKTAVLCLSLIGPAFAATPQDCAGGYALSVATANTTLQKALRACVAQSSPKVSVCVHKGVAAHQAALEKARDLFEECRETAVPPAR